MAFFSYKMTRFKSLYKFLCLLPVCVDYFSKILSEFGSILIGISVYLVPVLL